MHVITPQKSIVKALHVSFKGRVAGGGGGAVIAFM